MSSSAATKVATSATAGFLYADPAAPVLQETEKDTGKKCIRIKNKNDAHNSKKVAAKAETNTANQDNDDGKDVDLVSSTSVHAILIFKDKGIDTATNDHRTATLAGVSPAKDKGKGKNINHSIKATSATATALPKTQIMAAHFMTKFRKNKERHCAVSPPRQMTQYTAEEKYQQVICGLLKSQGVVNKVKTRTQIRREGVNSGILRTKRGAGMPEFTKQLSDLIIADNEALKSKEKEMNGKGKDDDGPLMVSNEQLLDLSLVKKGSLAQLLAIVAEIDKRIANCQFVLSSSRGISDPSPSSFSAVASENFDLSSLLIALTSQRARLLNEVGLLRVEDRARRVFLREDTTYDGRRGRMGMREGCAVPMYDPPVSLLMAEIQHCAARSDQRGEEGDRESDTEGAERPAGGSRAT